MTVGIKLRVTHARRLLPVPPYTSGTRRTASILIDDIRENDSQRGLHLPAQYIPYETSPGGPPGYIDLTFTSLVARSFESGDIRGLIDSGDVTAQFLVGSLVKQGFASVKEEALVTPYAVDQNTDFVLVNPDIAAPFTVNLPPGDSHYSGMVTVKDKKVMATVNPITINASAGETIDGASSIQILIDRGSWTLVFSGNEWSVV